MNKSDSTDLTNQIKLLLETMTSKRAEASENSEDEDCLISTDETSSENDDNDDNQSDLNDTVDSPDDDRYSITLRFNKFFRDHVENTDKHLPSTVGDNVLNDLQYEGKMYRVIPLKLDDKIMKSKATVAPNEARSSIKSL